MAKLLIDEKDTRILNIQELGLFLYLKGNVVPELEGIPLNYGKLKSEINMTYPTVKRIVEGLEEKNYVKTTKKGMPCKIYIEFLK